MVNVDRKILFAVAGLVFILVSGMAFLPCLKTREINFHGIRIAAYDDRSEKAIPGNSELLSIDRDSTALKIRYILNTGFTYPYAGITIVFKDSSGNYLDCSRFDALKIRIASSQLSDSKMYLKVFDEKVSKTNDPLSERYLKKDLLLNPLPKTISIPFEQFITPEWWFQRNNITLKDVNPVDFSKVTALQIESGSTAKTGIIDTLTISRIILSKRPNLFAVAMLALFFALMAGYAVFKSLPRRKNDPIIITYDKKDVRNYRDIDAQRIAGYLAERYSDPELSIVTMGKSLGLSQKKTVKVMNDVFKMSFKQYLTSIRIHEAKRLLQETDRLVIDIALTVGFNSISHFNRVFKASTHTNPLEFRNQKSADAQDIR